MNETSADRTRTRNLAIRLNERERGMLTAVADREQMTASEVVRWLVRREYERHESHAVDVTKHERSGIRQRRR